MKIAKKALYTVVGAGDAALESAKTISKRATELPKRATALPSLVVEKAQSFRGDASKRIERLTKRGQSLVQRNGKTGVKTRATSPARKRSSAPVVEATHASGTPSVPAPGTASQIPTPSSPLVSDRG